MKYGKVCSKCKVKKSHEEFYENSKWGFNSRCKNCERETYREKNNVKSTLQEGKLPKSAKPIPSYKNAWATPKGEIWGYNNRSGHFKRRQHVGWHDYMCVGLTNNDGVRRTRRVHRLIAEAFLHDFYDYPVVNHKDGNKQNNKLKNLEMCTYQENTLHASRVLGKKMGFATFNQWEKDDKRGK